MTIAPDSLFELVKQAFSDVEHPAYGQVANIDEKGFPQVRTVHIHYAPLWDALAFNTHIRSPKWEQFQKNPRLAGCYYDEHRLIQFRWESMAELIYPDSKKHADFLDQMWLKMRSDVRKAYCLDLGDNTENLSKRRPNLGAIISKPSIWHIYNINIEDFSEGTCTKHFLKNNAWRSQTVSLVQGQ